VHTPAWQTPAARVQATPQPPQLARSVASWVQVPFGPTPGQKSGREAGQVQLPPWQAPFARVQGAPQAPQLARSVARLVQVPCGPTAGQ
jgi:hypothetical protein